MCMNRGAGHVFTSNIRLRFMKSFFTLALIVLTVSSSRGQVFTSSGERTMKVDELKQYFADTTCRFCSPLLIYKGSDTQYHHFMRRMMDDFVFIKVNRTELTLPEVKPYSRTSSAPRCCYYIDVKAGFKRERDY